MGWKKKYKKIKRQRDEARNAFIDEMCECLEYKEAIEKIENCLKELKCGLSTLN